MNNMRGYSWKLEYRLMLLPICRPYSHILNNVVSNENYNDINNNAWVTVNIDFLDRD